jgi:rRNA-processing protein FCF1
MQTILLDTNFVVVPFTLGIDVYEELPKIVDGNAQLAVCSGVQDELQTLITSSDIKRDAKAALALLNSKVAQGVVQVIDADGHVDKAILSIVKSHKNCGVATQDKGLKKQLQEHNIPVYVIRQQNILHSLSKVKKCFTK